MEYQLYLRDHGIKMVWVGSHLKDHPVPTPSSRNKPVAYSSHPASVMMTTSQSDRATLKIPALSSQPQPEATHLKLILHLKDASKMQLGLLHRPY